MKRVYYLFILFIILFSGWILQNNQKTEYVDTDFKYLMETINDTPKTADEWNQIGGNLLERGEYEQALEFFDKALEENPNSSYIRFNKGLTLYHIGNYKEALENLDNILESYPFYEDAWMLKGLTLYALGEYEEAVNCYNNVLELNSNNNRAWNFRRLAMEYISPKSTWSIYRNKNHDFSLKIPRDWIMISTNNARLCSNFIPQLSLIFSICREPVLIKQEFWCKEYSKDLSVVFAGPTIWVSVVESTERIDFDHRVSECTSNEDGITEIERRIINGNEARLYKFKHDYNISSTPKNGSDKNESGVVSTESVMALGTWIRCNDKKVVYLECFAKSQEFPQYEETCMNIINSFHCT